MHSHLGPWFDPKLRIFLLLYLTLGANPKLSRDLQRQDAERLEDLFNSSDLSRRGITWLFARSLRILLKDTDGLDRLTWADVRCQDKLPNKGHGTKARKVQECMMVLAYELNRLLGIRHYKLAPYRGTGYQA